MQKVILYKLCIELFLWNIICISIIAKLLIFTGAAKNDSKDVSEKNINNPFILKQNINITCSQSYTHNIANMYDKGGLSFWTFFNHLILTPFNFNFVLD
jgi:beta-lactamase regulating signal transducer with metallopeptidase domain